MTDFEIANQITDTMNLFLQGFAMLSTVIFAYIAGAFYFLNRAPFFTKVMSFIFLVFAVSFILINMMGAFYHYMASSFPTYTVNPFSSRYHSYSRFCLPCRSTICTYYW